MKHLPLLVLIIFVRFGANAQTLGIKINPEADMLQGSPQPHFGIACGAFYNQKIYKVLGFSTGIEYEQIRYSNPPMMFFDFQPPSPYPKYKYQLVNLFEMPLDMTLLMNENKSAKCLVYFTIGYAFGDIFEQQAVYSESHSTYTVSTLNRPSKKMMSHSFRTGLEFRYNPRPRVNLAFGLQYKYKWMNVPWEGKDFNVFGAYIKTGLNFANKKVALKKS